jgi:hypothetical protein
VPSGVIIAKAPINSAVFPTDISDWRIKALKISAMGIL